MCSLIVCGTFPFKAQNESNDNSLIISVQVFCLFYCPTGTPVATELPPVAAAQHDIHCREDSEYPNGNICCLNCPPGELKKAQCKCCFRSDQERACVCVFQVNAWSHHVPRRATGGAARSATLGRTWSTATAWGGASGARSATQVTLNRAELMARGVGGRT